ncbi:translation initiation factor IF-2 [Saprospira grandis DSM 2844]|uniref:Translation initiation factor IF-2 n=1 Tax=Saprospira grandis DSM 2844 TaxID=694433 RepID=J0P4Y0_9BACT|nr:translation initiation factor IF-2 [Saprospira grandis]EJF52487.1 translation initiation factor IF-2 [Saprospira grandis DSM 2844]
MSKRLVKVAAELNIGTNTIVEYLNDNGYEVVNRPTAKVSDEMYDKLLARFNKSAAIKEEADKITIGSRLEKEKKEEEKRKKEKERQLAKAKQEAKPVKKVEITTPKEETPVVKQSELSEKKEETKDNEVVSNMPKGPKILGKINLDEQSRSGRRKGGRKTTAKKEQAPKKEEPKPKQEEKAKQEVKATPRKEKAPKAKEEPKQETPKQEETKSPKVVEEKQVVAKKTEQKTEEKPEATTEKKKDGVDIKMEAPQLKGLKILGKINIEDPRRKRKKKRNRKKIGGTDDKKPQEKQEAKKGGEKKEEKKDGNNDRTKRKRTKISTNQAQNDNRGKSKDNRGGTGSNNQQTANSNKKRKKKGKRREISDKEVDDKLKQTMQRLHGGGKKGGRRSTRASRDEKKEAMRQRMEEEMEEPQVLQVTEFISVSELAGLLNATPADIIMMCMQIGQFVSINQRLDAEIIELIATEYDYEVEFISAEDQVDIEEEEEEDDPADLKPRSPIVTVMGHVDHGKTSLLDHIRKANVAEGEAGGITQHIGAYEVKVRDMGSITFLDTPGHEAFTAMRARGAKVTDVAVIIIAADDNIMPQTKEAISHAQAAEVPIIFAINKIDKEGAQPEKIKQELASMNLLVEEWGGTYQSQDISAKQGLNVDLLLEKILLESEMLELKANPSRRAIGAILEASLEKGRGYVAKVLVQTGTLAIGDPIIAGQYHGRVKAMFDERGKRVKKAGPSTPVLVLGLDGAPQAGEKLQVLESERKVKELANKRGQIIRQQQIRATRRITLDDITRRLKVGNFQELNLIVKGDMDGSVEALADSLLKLSTEQIQTNIIYKAVGQITESDVNLAAASDAIIIGFQVRPNPSARRLSEQEGVEIKTYSIIYDAIEEVRAALEGMLEPKQVEETIGSVAIQTVFSISKVGKVAGCMVQSGKVTRNSHIRVIRDGIVIFPKKEGQHGELSSLKRFKDSVPEVKNGFECGLTIRNFDGIREGDEIEVYEIKEVKQTL